MNTQNTPVHIKLWHREFWLMSISSLFLTMSVYALIPVMPQWLMMTKDFSPEKTGLSMGAFALGLYFFGAQCSWLVQKYRRNVICMQAIFAVVVAIALLWYIDSLRTENIKFWMILLQRLALGAVFGLAQMVLSSTLIIDTCESFQRTEANHSATWFARFALSLGPLVGLLTYELYGFQAVVWTSMGLAGAALVLLKLVDFPFRTPEEGVHVASLDRFFLPHGFVLFVNLVLVCVVVGLLLTLPHKTIFYALVMAGFLLALLAQRFVFRDAELKSEVVTGLILMIAAICIMMAYPESPVAPVLTGLSVGIIGTRFLLFFIKLSRHCQRGTSQSTYFLGWETGLSAGVGLGYLLFYNQSANLLYTALAITVVALLMYHFYTHSWFVRNKNR